MYWFNYYENERNGKQQYVKAAYYRIIYRKLNTAEIKRNAQNLINNIQELQKLSLKEVCTAVRKQNRKEYY